MYLSCQIVISGLRIQELRSKKNVLYRGPVNKLRLGRSCWLLATPLVVCTTGGQPQTVNFATADTSLSTVYCNYPSTEFLKVEKPSVALRLTAFRCLRHYITPYRMFRASVLAIFGIKRATTIMHKWVIFEYFLGQSSRNDGSWINNWMRLCII